MTKKQIMTAWSKSANKSMTTHKEFEEKMVLKTLINSGCQKVINGTPNMNGIAPVDDDEIQDPIKGGKDSEPFMEFEEAQEDMTVAPITADTTAAPTADTEPIPDTLLMQNDEF